MDYVVLPRRYRPVSFEEVVGQEHVTRSLANALRAGRVSHAYLLSGPRGVGKTTVARVLAKCLNCERRPGPSPCGECPACLRIHAGTDHDVVEIDAASNRNVEDARLLRESVRYRPLQGRHRVYIIDEAHMLTRDAFNTLLKTLEEPPPHVKFVFATTEPHRMPETIVSRCQHFEFRRLGRSDVVRRLEQICARENLPVAKPVLEKIAAAARGAMRDAEVLLEQLVAYRGSDIREEDVRRLAGWASEESLMDLFDAARRGSVADVFARVADIFEGGADPVAFVDQAIETARALLVTKVCGADSPLAELGESSRRAANELASAFSLEALLYTIQLLIEAHRRLREGLPARTVLELAFAKIARISDLVSLGEALKLLRQGAAPAPAPAAAAPDELSRKWNAFLESLDRAGYAERTILRECSPASLNGRVLEVRVPPHLDTEMQRKNFERLRRRGTPVSAALERVFGEGARLEFVSSRIPVDTGTDPEVKELLEGFPGSRLIEP